MDGARLRQRVPGAHCVSGSTTSTPSSTHSKPRTCSSTPRAASARRSRRAASNGPSIFPVTSLGGRVQWSFSPAWSARMALLDGVPGDPESSGGEPHSVWARTTACSRLPKWATPARSCTSSRLGRGATPRSSTRSRPRTVKRRPRAFGAIAASISSGKEQLFAESDDSAQGLNAFMRSRHGERSPQSVQGFRRRAVCVYTGALPNRPEDQLGLAISSVGNGSVRIGARWGPTVSHGSSRDQHRADVSLWRDEVVRAADVRAAHQQSGHESDAWATRWRVGLRFELIQGWSWPPSSRRH